MARALLGRAECGGRGSVRLSRGRLRRDFEELHRWGQMFAGPLSVVGRFVKELEHRRRRWCVPRIRRIVDGHRRLARSAP